MFGECVVLVSLGMAASIGVNIENIEEKGRARACLEQWSTQWRNAAQPA